MVVRRRFSPDVERQMAAFERLLNAAKGPEEPTERSIEMPLGEEPRG
jgi:hypothetical protein